MKYIKKFNESSFIEKVKEVTFDERMMVDTLTPLSIIRRNYSETIEKIGNLIIDQLNKNIVEERLGDDSNFFFKKPSNAFNFFTTSLIDENDLKKMFNNVIIHPGSDDEDEYVASVKINGVLTLLLHSPERGSQIRINQHCSNEGLYEIYKSLIEYYNNKL